MDDIAATVSNVVGWTRSGRSPRSVEKVKNTEVFLTHCRRRLPRNARQRLASRDSRAQQGAHIALVKNTVVKLTVSTTRRHLPSSDGSAYRNHSSAMVDMRFDSAALGTKGSSIPLQGYSSPGRPS